eukprot:351800-Chlamydomonas_euryale.AAC.1
MPARPRRRRQPLANTARGQKRYNCKGKQLEAVQLQGETTKAVQLQGETTRSGTTARGNNTIIYSMQQRRHPEVLRRACPFPVPPTPNPKPAPHTKLMPHTHPQTGASCSLRLLCRLTVACKATRQLAANNSLFAYGVKGTGPVVQMTAPQIHTKGLRLTGR